MIKKGGSIKIVEFYNASVDSTNYITNGRSAVDYDGKKHYGTLAPGKFTLTPFIRGSKGIRVDDGNPYAQNDGKVRNYLAFYLNEGGRVPTVGKNFAYPTRNPPFATGILLHAATAGSWNTSEGCQVIESNDYVNKLMPYFGKFVKPRDDKEGFWQFDSKRIGKGTYYLINQ